MSTATMPRRIGTLQYLLADLTTALFGPDHKGADELWFTELRIAGPASRAAIPYPHEAPTVIIPAVRRPIAAIAAHPHVEQVCPLDACPLDLGPLEPARLFDARRYAQIGAAA